MNIQPLNLEISPLVAPPSNLDNEGVDDKKHIAQSGTASYSSATKSLKNRSAIHTTKVSGPELRKLILEQNFSNNIHYQVEGDLYLDGYTGLTALPENLSVRGVLSINNCTGLTALPKNLSVGGDLRLIRCTGLTALPKNFTVRGYISLNCCTGLTALPKNFSVRSSLSLTGCTGLTALPKNLSVRGYLSLNGCTGLTALPERLSVRGYLSLKGCTGLRSLPEISVGGDLYLTGCTGLSALPNWITTMGAKVSDGCTRNVYLENTGLSDALIDRLRTLEAPGMQFHFSRRAGQPEQQFSSMEQAFAFWRTLALSDAETPEPDIRSDQTVDLIHFLGRLTGTADYQNQASRPVLAQRVIKVISLLAGNDRVRDDAMGRIHNALSSCDDRVILSLDDLATLQLLTSAETLAFEHSDPRALRTLGLQMMRLDEVKRIARDHMKTLRWVDEIEVELAFQIGVHKQLDLPGSTQHMLFRGCSQVSDQDIANAVQQVNNRCSEAQLEAYLAQWVPWQKFQRQQTVPSFGQLESRTVARIDDCPICAEKTDKMVMLGDVHYDYDALLKAFLENGKNPLTHTPLDWSNVVRLTEVLLPSPPKKANVVRLTEELLPSPPKKANVVRLTEELLPSPPKKANVVRLTEELLPSPPKKAKTKRCVIM